MTTVTMETELHAVTRRYTTTPSIYMKILSLSIEATVGFESGSTLYLFI